MKKQLKKQSEYKRTTSLFLDFSFSVFGLFVLQIIVFRGKLDEELYKPYLKRYYRNKHTKTYKKLLARIEKVNDVDEESLFYGKLKKIDLY